MKKTNRKSNTVFRAIALCFLIVYAALFCFLLFWGVMSSFKHVLDFTIYADSIFPKFDGFQWDNYSVAYLVMHVTIDTATGGTQYIYIEQMILHSVLWVFGSVFFNVCATVLVSYCCARFKGHTFSKVVYFITIIVITLPITGSLPSQMRVVRALNLYDSWLIVPAMKITFTNTYFLVFYGIFTGLPTSYREAAEMDGAGHWTILIRIMLPLVFSTVLAVTVLWTIAYWNDYSTSMMFLPSYPVVAQGVYDLIHGQSGRDSRVNDATSLAAAYMNAIPTLILFLLFRDKIMTNVSIGGLKG